MRRCVWARYAVCGVLCLLAAGLLASADFLAGQESLTGARLRRLSVLAVRHITGSPLTGIGYDAFEAVLEHETNATRAARVARESLAAPATQRGSLSPHAFSILWGRGLKEMFAAREDGSLVQIRAYGADLCLHALEDPKPKAAEEASGSGDEVRTTVEIIRQIGEGVYAAIFVDNLGAGVIALLHPGPLLADGDTLEGTFGRIGTHRHGGSNLARYIMREDAPTPAVAAAARAKAAEEAPTPASLQAVYDAFQNGEISFVLPAPVAMPCLTCDGTGKEIDEAWILRETESLYRSNYNRHKTGGRRKGIQDCLEQAWENQRWRASSARAARASATSPSTVSSDIPFGEPSAVAAVRGGGGRGGRGTVSALRGGGGCVRIEALES